jgi:hypothetical protein
VPMRSIPLPVSISHCCERYTSPLASSLSKSAGCR